MKIKKIVLFSFLILFLFTGCSNNKIYLNDVNKLLSEDEISSISHITTKQYKFYVFIANEYTFEDDYTCLSNNFINQHNINQDNLIMYYIGMEKHVINIQVTDYVQTKISQHRLDKAASIMANSFISSQFAEGIIKSILYLDNE